MHALKALCAVCVISALSLTHAMAEERDIVNVGFGTKANLYNPAFTSSNASTRILMNVFMTLVQEGPSGGIVPGISERWEVSEGRLVYDFWIDPDAVWSDGAPFTPASIAASFNLVETLPERSAIKGISAATVSTAERDGAEVLRITLREPTSQLLPYLTQPHNAPLPMHKADVLDFTDPWEVPDVENMVFSGAYVINHVSDERLELSANPFFFGAESLRNDGLVIHFYDERDRLVYRDIQSGALDLAIVRGAGQAGFLEQVLADYYVPLSTPSINMLVLNPNRPPFDNIEIRRAIQRVANMSGETQLLRSNNLTATSSLLPKHMQTELHGVIDVAAWTDKAEDFNTARAMMERLGYFSNNPLEIDFEINRSDLHKQMATVMRSRLSQIHINATIVERDWAVHWPNLLAHDFGIARVGWRYDVNHPANLLAIFTSGNEYNFPETAFADYDALVERIEAAQSPDELAQLTRQAEKFLWDQAVAIPLYQAQLSLLRRPGLRYDPPLFAGYIRLSSVELP